MRARPQPRIEPAVLCLLAALWGCTTPDPLEPIVDSAVRFAEMERIRVARGDTLNALAKRYDVSLNDLVAWNNLHPDQLEVGQQLNLWRQRSPTPNLTERVPWEYRFKSNEPNTSQLATALGAEPSPSAPIARATPRPSTKRTSAPTSARSALPAPDTRANDTRHDEDDGPGGAFALLGTLERSGGLDAGLRDNLAGMSGRTGTPGRTNLSGRSGDLSSRSDAEASAAIDRPKTETMGAIIPDGPFRPPRLSKPAAKRCLSQPSGANLGDNGVAAGQGLTTTQIKSVLTAFVRQTRACIPSGTSGRFTVRVELDVGCNGVVAGSRVVSASPSVPDALSRCVADTLHFASFPAHDLPDGATFQYPINFAY